MHKKGGGEAPFFEPSARGNGESDKLFALQRPPKKPGSIFNRFEVTLFPSAAGSLSRTDPKVTFFPGSGQEVVENS